MEINHIREALSRKLDEANLQYDIKKMVAERDYHKSKTEIFDQAIKAQREDLEKILVESLPNGEMYK